MKYINIKSISICILVFIFLLVLYNFYSPKYYITKNDFLNKNFIDKIFKTITSENKWVYTTNIGNEKIKNNNNIISRKEKAISMYNDGLFSYSKYEYDNNAEILYEIKKNLLEKKTLDTISY